MKRHNIYDDETLNIFVISDSEHLDVNDHECIICYEPCTSGERYVKDKDTSCVCALGEHVSDKTVFIHHECQMEWQRYSNDCPVCRTPLLRPREQSECDDGFYLDAIIDKPVVDIVSPRNQERTNNIPRNQERTNNIPRSFKETLTHLWRNLCKCCIADVRGTDYDRRCT